MSKKTPASRRTRRPPTAAGERWIRGAAPAVVTSPSHPIGTAWNSTPEVLFVWTLPPTARDASGAYYVLDHYGDTIPTSATTFVPAGQTQVLKKMPTPGVWVFHLVWSNRKGELADHPAHYPVRIGKDPGSGSIVGSVLDESRRPVAGAPVRVNRGLFPDSVTDAAGNFAFPNVPVGVWSVTVAIAAFKPATLQAAVTSGKSCVLTVSLVARGRSSG